MSTYNSPPEALRKPHDGHAPWLLRRIWDRLNRQNGHFMGAIVGAEGDGKSYTAIRIADEIDPTFSADRVLFDVADLLRTLKDGDHEQGNFYVLDEAGVEFGRRTWQDRAQILANQALQLIRNHNLGLIFTVPRLGELDSQAQGRLQAFFEVTEKQHDEYVEGKWKFMDPDRSDQTGQIYKHFPRRRKGGKVIRVTSFAFRPPRDELVEPYEERKRAFQERFYEEVINKLEGNEEGGGKDKFDAKKVASDIIENELSEYISRHNQTKEPYIDKDLIRAEYEISHANANTVKSLIEKDVSQEELESHA